jgi:UDP:flavonoid glycosyltransferase YjiC (YdhE family)
MTNRSIAFFVMRGASHVNPLRPLISGVAGRGITSYVFTDRRHRVDVERAGGTFVDLFAAYPLERADDESLPVPCRFVSFAARYAEDVLRDLEEMRPSLVVYDTHAVIGRVVGAALGVPYVAVCSGHNASPDRLPLLTSTVASIRISASCRRAVGTLRDRWGVDDASPFSFVSGLSPFLNVYPEPAAYLTEAERQGFEPVAFHGCLPTQEEIEARRLAGGPSYFDGDATALKVYASFGRVVRRYWPAETLGAARAISEAVAGMPDVCAVIDASSLGGPGPGAESVRALTNPNVSVRDDVDQWTILQEADVFVTHNGLNSTHEAILHRVPMVSYPFYWDQPALAEKCRSLGLAIPLTETLRGPVGADDAHTAFAELSSRREALRAALAEAREWEWQVIADRSSVLQRITDLIEA